MSERLLNLYKVVEVVFGRDADQLRVSLGSLGVPDDVIEGIFVALLYVRDELDVGHPAVHMLGQENWQLMHAFAERAEDGVTWLLAKLTGAVADGTFKLRTLGAPKKSKLLQLIAARANVRVKAYGHGGWTNA